MTEADRRGFLQTSLLAALGAGGAAHALAQAAASGSILDREADGRARLGAG